MKSYLSDDITIVDHIIHHDEYHPGVKHKKGLNSPPPSPSPYSAALHTHTHTHTHAHTKTTYQYLSKKLKKYLKHLAQKSQL